MRNAFSLFDPHTLLVSNHPFVQNFRSAFIEHAHLALAVTVAAHFRSTCGANEGSVSNFSETADAGRSSMFLRADEVI